MVSAANTNSGTSTSASEQGSRAPFTGSPIAHETAVVATGARTDESGKRELFKESTTTALVFPNGGVIRLSAAAAPGQLLFLTNPQSRREVVAQVTRRRHNPSSGFYIELEFTEPAPDFWGIKFPDVGPAETAISTPQPQPAEPTIAPAAAEFLQPAEPSDDLNPNAPAPTAGDVQALVEEIEALRAQLRSVQTQNAAAPVPGLPAMQLPAAQNPVQSSASPAAQNPTPTPDLGAMLSSLVASIPAPQDASAPASPSGSPASGAPNASPAPQKTRTHEPDELDATLLPKPALDFQKAKVPPPNSAAHAPVAPPSDRAGILRLALLAVVSLFAVTLAAWNMHWLPWLAPKSAVSDRVASNSQPAATAPSPRPAAQPKPGAKADSSSVAPTPTNSLPAAAPSAIPDSAGDAAARPTSSDRADASPPPSGRKSHPARDEELSIAPITPVSKRSGVRDSKATDSDSSPSVDDGSITPPRLIKSVRAVAPGDALRQFMTGNVTLDALIDKTGQVKSMKILSGPASFHKAAMEALKHYRYEPARQNGKPVSAHITVTIPFWFEP